MKVCLLSLRLVDCENGLNSESLEDIRIAGLSLLSTELAELNYWLQKAVLRLFYLIGIWKETLWRDRGNDSGMCSCLLLTQI